MIEWIKYDPENPPNEKEEYLISDGTNIDVALYAEEIWFVPDISSVDGESAITHYAPINLPGEETTE